jgi:cytochrome P450
MLMEHPNLDLVAAQSLLPFGITFWPPMPDIFQQHGPRARNNTFFLRTLLDLTRGPRLERVFSEVLQDAREYFEGLSTTNSVGLINAPVIWPAVFKQSSRIFLGDDLAADPELFAEASKHLEVILHTFSPFYTFLHWIPEPSMIRRRLARYGIFKVWQKVYRNRISGKTPRRDDAMQFMIDKGANETNILEFCTSGSFITTANAHIIFPRLIEVLAVHQEWQEKVYQEILAAADQYATTKNGSLLDRLATVPLHAWEKAFPILDLCMLEICRAWTSFPVARLNVSNEAIPIPGSDEVIPAGAYAAYNSSEVNFDPVLYPNPHNFDPERFLEGRREFEKEPLGCKYLCRVAYLYLR